MPTLPSRSWLEIEADINEQRRLIQTTDSEMIDRVLASLDKIAESRLILAKADKIIASGCCLKRTGPDTVRDSDLPNCRQ
jgi:hypothetical protein